jgi:hypothetical protein
MRKIRTPKSIYRYGDSLLKQWKDSYLEYHEYDESLNESIDISDYEELHYPLRDGDKYYQLYRKIENGKGVWAAAELDKYGSNVVGEPFKITYEQARGFEPIEDSSIRKLSRDLGKKLLPKRENLNEAYRPLAIGYMILKKEIPNHVNYAEFANYDEVVTAIPSEGDVVVYPRGGKISGTDIAYWQFDAIDSEGKKTKANFDTYVYSLKDFLNNDEMELKLISDFKLIDEYPYLIEVDDDIEESLTEGIEDLDSISSTKAKDMNDADFKILKPLVDEYLKDRKALGNWPDSVDERNFVKKWYKLADKCKEIAKNGIKGITGYGRLNDAIKLKIVDLARSVDNTFPWYIRNSLAKFNELESLQEKLNNIEKHDIIKAIVNGEEDDLQTIVDEIYFYDRALYLKLRHFTKKNSLNDKKDYLIKVLQDSLEESLTEDTIKQNGKWVNKGSEGTHGKFRTKKAADAQRKAMFANGYKAESLNEDLSSIQEVKQLNFNNNRVNNLRGIFSVKNLVKALNDTGLDALKIRTSRLKNVSQGDIKDAWYDLKRNGWTVSIERDPSLSGFNEVYVFEKIKNESLKEDIEDEIDIEEYDFDDGVEEGTNFIEDGTEWVWIERIAGPIHLDFDNWAVWSAREYVDPRDFITTHDNGKGYDFDEDGFKKKAMAAPVNYFVVDEDTGFIDWGPVETQTEAQDFLNSKVEDWENDMDESLNKNNKLLKEYFLHYDDVGDGREYDYDLDYDDAVDYLFDLMYENGEYPDFLEDKSDEEINAWLNDEKNIPKFREWIEDNLDKLIDKYEYDLMNHFFEDASEKEYEERNRPYEPEYDPMDW